MSQVQEVKEASDIVAVIGQKVSLQRSGSYMRGLCPFHSESSPSFFVDENLQRYKCFGCGESGDVITFLQKYDGMSFGEALENLAEMAGITLKKYERNDEDKLRGEILEVLDLAKEYYHYLLTQHQIAEPAREYLKNRKVNSESVKLFNLGYAPPQWDSLIKFLYQKKNYRLDLLVQAGLAIKSKNGKYYDRFRERVIFPLKDHRGRVVGFSGRTLSKDDKEAKYINSPETLVYHKSQMLFGFSELYQYIRKEKQVVVVEGEFDVISSTQAHMNKVVAIKGSALTKEHAKLLERTVESVLLSLDTDSAGVKATKKAITALNETKLDLRVVVIPDGKDPDELIKTNPKLWREAVQNSINAHQFLIDVALKTHDKDKPEGKRAIINELCPSLAEIKHAVELEYYIKHLAEQIKSKPENVRLDIERYKAGLPPEDHSVKADKEEDDKIDTQTTLRIQLEDYILYLILQMSDQTLATSLNLLETLIKNDIFVDKNNKKILEKIVESQKSSKNSAIPYKQLLKELPPELQDLILEKSLLNVGSGSDKINQDQNKVDLLKELETSVKKLNEIVVTKQIDLITDRLAELDEIDVKTEIEQNEQNELLRKIVELKKSVK